MLDDAGITEYKAVTISFWREDIDEPIITAGKLVYSDISKRDHWDLWIQI